MGKKDRPLPQPPNQPFGRRLRPEGEEQKEPLMADKMAMAMAEGKLDEFLKRELPDNEHARKLAMMMMGMTGMMPTQPAPSATEDIHRKTETSDDAASDNQDFFKAVKKGSMKGLMGKLEKEYKKRLPNAASGFIDDKMGQPAEQAIIEKSTIEELIAIANDNNLPLDWLLLRALKVYVQDYKKTGRL